MANSDSPLILSVNAGSSSIRFALFPIELPRNRYLSGKVSQIGMPRPIFAFRDSIKNQKFERPLQSSSKKSVPKFLIRWLEDRVDFARIRLVGHRVVFGLKHIGPDRITPQLLRDLRRLIPYDPEHLPCAIELMEEFRRRHSNLKQIAFFDTAFHRTMPRVARLLPIPRRFDRKGVQRYGFHGLSVEYLVGELSRIAPPKESRGRVILAHLGNGASLTAVHKGRSLDTSMGFTPAAGLPMGTRPGDLDPGIAWTLMSQERLSLKKFNHLINHECGLLGVSETSSDMQKLLSRQLKDVRAREAVELFCYQTKKWIGAFAAALGGVETLVFSSGIGENSPEVRARICAGLEYLGIVLDPARNKMNDGIISKKGSKVTVRIIRTDEEVHIANMLVKYLK